MKAKIVLNTEPRCTSECPFSDEMRGCKLSNPDAECKAIWRTPDENGIMTDSITFDTETDEWQLLIDFEQCPYCTTFVKEYSFQKELDKEE